MTFEYLNVAVEMTVKGMGTTFFILGIFYLMIKLMSKLFVNREKEI